MENFNGGGKMNKAIFWKLTDEIFGDTFFDNENVTTEEIRSKFFNRMKENKILRKSPVYSYWLHRSVYDLFESEENQGGQTQWM